MTWSNCETFSFSFPLYTTIKPSKCTRKLFTGIGQQEAQNHNPREKENIQGELPICICFLTRNTFHKMAQRSGARAELSGNRDQCSGWATLLKFTGQDKGEKGATQKGDFRRGECPQGLAENGCSGRWRWVEIPEVTEF